LIPKEDTTAELDPVRGPTIVTNREVLFAKKYWEECQRQSSLKKVFRSD